MDVSMDIAEGAGWASTRVLVVDDHDGFRTGMASILVAEGLTVDTAPSGEAALLRAAGFKPDVVLMDEDMPGMSGEEATRRMLRTVGSASVVMFGFRHDGMLDAVRSARGLSEQGRDPRGDPRRHPRRGSSQPRDHGASPCGAVGPLRPDPHARGYAGAAIRAGESAGGLTATTARWPSPVTAS